MRPTSDVVTSFLVSNFEARGVRFFLDNVEVPAGDVFLPRAFLYPVLAVANHIALANIGAEVVDDFREDQDAMFGMIPVPRPDLNSTLLALVFSVAEEMFPEAQSDIHLDLLVDSLLDPSQVGASKWLQ